MRYIIGIYIIGAFIVGGFHNAWWQREFKPLYISPYDRAIIVGALSWPLSIGWSVKNEVYTRHGWLLPLTRDRKGGDA